MLGAESVVEDQSQGVAKQAKQLTEVKRVIIDYYSGFAIPDSPERYIRLVHTDSTSGTSKLVTIGSLIDTGHRLTFVQADSRMGKSVLASHCAKKWSEGKLWPELEYLFVIDCENYGRQFDPQNTISLSKWLYWSPMGRGFGLDDITEAQFRDFFKSIVDQKPESVGFVIDGIDRISSDHKDALNLLLKNERYQRCPVILTRRLGLDLDHNFDSFDSCMHVRVSSLSLKLVEQFIQSFFFRVSPNKQSAKEKANRLYEIIYSTPCFNELARSPAVLTKMCELFSGKDGCDLFQDINRGKLYGEIIKVWPELADGEVVASALSLFGLTGKTDNEEQLLRSGIVNRRRLYGGQYGYEFYSRHLEDYFAANAVVLEHLKAEPSLHARNWLRGAIIRREGEKLLNIIGIVSSHPDAQSRIATFLVQSDEQDYTGDYCLKFLALLVEQALYERDGRQSRDSSSGQGLGWLQTPVDKILACLNAWYVEFKKMGINVNNSQLGRVLRHCPRLCILLDTLPGNLIVKDLKRQDIPLPKLEISSKETEDRKKSLIEDYRKKYQKAKGELAKPQEFMAVFQYAGMDSIKLLVKRYDSLYEQAMLADRESLRKAKISMLSRLIPTAMSEMIILHLIQYVGDKNWTAEEELAAVSGLKKIDMSELSDEMVDRLKGKIMISLGGAGLFDVDRGLEFGNARSTSELRAHDLQRYEDLEMDKEDKESRIKELSDEMLSLEREDERLMAEITSRLDEECKSESQKRERDIAVFNLQGDLDQVVMRRKEKDDLSMQLSEQIKDIGREMKSCQNHVNQHSELNFEAELIVEGIALIGTLPPSHVNSKDIEKLVNSLWARDKIIAGKTLETLSKLGALVDGTVIRKLQARLDSINIDDCENTLKSYKVLGKYEDFNGVLTCFLTHVQGGDRDVIYTLARTLRSITQSAPIEQDGQSINISQALIEVFKQFMPIEKQMAKAAWVSLTKLWGGDTQQYTSIVERLREQVRSGDLETQLCAAEMAGHVVSFVGDTELLSGLIDLLESSDERVLNQTIGALLLLVPERAPYISKALEGEGGFGPDIQKAVLGTLAALSIAVPDSPALELLLSKFQSSKESISYDIVIELASLKLQQIPGQVSQVLLRDLQSEDQGECHAAVSLWRHLSALKVPTEVTVGLIKNLTNDSKHVRDAAVEILSIRSIWHNLYQDDEKFSALCCDLNKLLDSVDTQKRLAIVRVQKALASFGCTYTDGDNSWCWVGIEVIQDIIHDDVRVQQEALESLKTLIALPVALKMVLKFLSDDEKMTSLIDKMAEGNKSVRVFLSLILPRVEKISAPVMEKLLGYYFEWVVKEGHQEEALGLLKVVNPSKDAEDVIDDKLFDHINTRPKPEDVDPVKYHRAAIMAAVGIKSFSQRIAYQLYLLLKDERVIEGLKPFAALALSKDGGFRRLWGLGVDEKKTMTCLSEHLVECLQEKMSKTIRMQAIEAIREAPELASSDIVGRLYRIAVISDQDLATEAALAIGEMPSFTANTQALKVLISLLGNPNDVLGGAGGDEMSRDMDDRLYCPIIKYSFRKLCSHIIEEKKQAIDQEVLNDMIQMLYNRQDSTRENIVALLSWMKGHALTPESVKRLCNCLTSEETVVSEAARKIFTSLNHKYVTDELMSSLKSCLQSCDDTGKKICIIGILGYFGAKETIPQDYIQGTLDEVVRSLRSSPMEVRNHEDAAQLIGNLGISAARSQVLSYLASFSSEGSALGSEDMVQVCQQWASGIFSLPEMENVLIEFSVCREVLDEGVVSVLSEWGSRTELLKSCLTTMQDDSPDSFVTCAFIMGLVARNVGASVWINRRVEGVLDRTAPYEVRMTFGEYGNKSVCRFLGAEQIQFLRHCLPKLMELFNEPCYDPKKWYVQYLFGDGSRPDTFPRNAQYCYSQFEAICQVALPAIDDDPQMSDRPVTTEGLPASPSRAGMFGEAIAGVASKVYNNIPESPSWMKLRSPSPS